MKQFLLPIALLSFAISCLMYVHMDNMELIDQKVTELEHEQIKMDTFLRAS